ncbi:MAG: Lrp/AsnC family transcriptional regulator, partial [Candidatus Thorarchaeota archaeon]
MAKIDEKDFKILELLRENARMTTGELSKKIGIPQTTIHNRIKRMRENGIIKRFTVDVDRKKIGKNVVAYILCSVSYRTSRGEMISQYDVAKII